MTNREALLICLTALDAPSLASALMYNAPLISLICQDTKRLSGTCPFDRCEHCLTRWLARRCTDIDTIRDLFPRKINTEEDTYHG